MNRSILLALSDTHAGFSLALMNPEVALEAETEDGELYSYTPLLTESQEYLWELYTEGLKKVVELANGAPIYAIHNGDLCDGFKHPGARVSGRISDQVLIGVANLRPICEMPNLQALRLSIGTQAHNGGMGALEYLALQQLKALYPTSDIQAVYHGMTTIQGVAVDYAHHRAYPGSRVWLAGNVHRLYLRSYMMGEVLAGREPAKLMLGGHYHQYQKVVEEVGGRSTTSIITPSFCMLSDYGHQATRSVHEITNGMVAVELIDGEVGRVIPLIKSVDIRTKEVL